MTKFVCDFDIVNSIAANLDNVSTNLTSSLNDYYSTLETDLSGWSGDAKSKFIASNEEKVKLIKSKLEDVTELSSFIKKASHSIQELDDQLSSMKI